MSGVLPALIVSQAMQQRQQAAAARANREPQQWWHTRNVVTYSIVGVSLLGLGIWGINKWIKGSQQEKPTGLSKIEDWASRFNSAIGYWYSWDQEDELYQIALEIPDENTWKAVQAKFKEKYPNRLGNTENLDALISSRLDGEEYRKFKSYLNKTNTLPPESILKEQGLTTKQYLAQQALNAQKSHNDWSANRQGFILPSAGKTAPVQTAYPRYLTPLTAWYEAQAKTKITVKPISYLNFGKVVGFRKNSSGVYDLIKIEITNPNMPEFGKQLWFIPSPFTAKAPPSHLSGKVPSPGGISSLLV